MPDYQQDTRRTQNNVQNNRVAHVEIVQQVAERIAHSVGQVILGKRNEIRLMVLGLLSQGHILIEDIPGVGKTMMTKALARSLGCTFSRIQFTPDMLPSDVTGVTIFNPESRKFEFRPGPIISQVVLADEINRATPKTQSALLEAMEERQVTVDGVTYAIQEPFIVLATQNPIEYEGTFPLPEAQLDRFLLRLTLGYPAPAEEMAVLSSQQREHPLSSVFQVVTAEELIQAQTAVRDVYVADEVKRYIIDIVTATRQHPEVSLGSSPRGSLALFRASQTRAAMAGREYVIPDDVKALAEVALSHRIILRPTARIQELSPRAIVQDVLARTPIPGASVWQ
ncbi:MAG: MoxR family ATPase [bacterium]|nr:MoxR family ATPase [bacterium]